MKYRVVLYYVPSWDLNSVNHCYYNVLYNKTNIPAATGFQTKESAESYVEELKKRRKTYVKKLNAKTKT